MGRDEEGKRLVRVREEKEKVTDIGLGEKEGHDEGRDDDEAGNE
jgi:hypothetical protein